MEIYIQVFDKKKRERLKEEKDRLKKKKKTD